MKKRALILYTRRNYFACGQVMCTEYGVGNALNKYQSSPGSIDFIIYMLGQGFGINTIGRYVTFYDAPYNNNMALTHFTRALFDNRMPTRYDLYDMFDNPEYVILLASAADKKQNTWKSFQITEGRQMQLLTQNITYEEQLDSNVKYARIEMYYNAVTALINELQIKPNPVRNEVKFKLINNLVADLANGKKLPNPSTIKETIEKY